MIRQYNRSSLRGIALFIAVLTLIALAALAQTTGPGPRSGKSSVARASTNPIAALGAEELPRPMDANPFIFVSPVIYDSGGSIATSVAVADLNGDGKPDLVVASCSIGPRQCYESVGGVGVLLGNGDGTFQPVVTYASGGFQSISVAIADVNGDGKPDLLVTNSATDLHDGEGSVGVLLGNGDGTFQAAATYDAMANDTLSAAVADVNGDGKLDIAVASLCSAEGGCGGSNSVVAILLGNGDGTFRPGALYHVASTEGFRFVTLADVNRDGKPDLLVADDGGAEVLLGNGDGTFRAAQTYSSGGDAVSMAVGDVNGDGKLDLLVVDGDSLALLLGNGDGTFQSPTVVLSGNVTYVAVRDVNGDGKPDLVTLYGGVGVMLGNGDGTFQPLSSNDDFDGGGVGIAIADMNGDGKPDIAIAIQGTGGLGVLLNNNGATPTTTALASTANPARIHEVVTYTATVTAQSGGAVSGVVLFRQNGATQTRATVAGNQATFSLQYKKPGSPSITAFYSGDLEDTSSAAGPLTEQIIKAHSSKTTLTTSGSPSFPGQTVTFTATVTSTGGAIPDGELVTFFDGKTTLGSVALAGGTAAYATSSLAVKRHNIKATYAGDADFNPSTGTILQVVDSWPTTTVLASSPNPSAQGQAVTFTATVTSDGPMPAGTVKFVDGNSVDLGSAKLSGGIAILTRSTLAVGTHPIFAEYKGNITSHKSFSNTVNQVVQ